MKQFLILVILQSVLTLSAEVLPNYQKTTTYLRAGKGDSIVQVAYIDGLGRTRESSSSGYSTNGQQKMHYTLCNYDKLGRVQEEYLPVPRSVASDHLTYQTPSGFNDSHYRYSTITYDSWDRPIRKSSPGSEWHRLSKGIMYQYGQNGTGTQESQVKKYGVTEGSSLATESGSYPSGTLRMVVTIDEDQHRTYSFTDSQGVLVLERRHDGTTYLDTYYVYDACRRLRFVLPPLYQSCSTDEEREKVHYRYDYDSRGRCVVKKLPGCHPIRYGYDLEDRVISMQDGLLNQAGRYRRYEYDGLGRLTRQYLSSSSTGTSGTDVNEVINIYDDYARLASILQGHTNGSILLSDLNAAYSDNGRGRLIGTWQTSSATGGGSGVWTVYLYDDKGQVSETITEHPSGYLVKNYQTHNFIGAVTSDSVRVLRRVMDGSLECILASGQRDAYNYQGTKLLEKSTLKVSPLGTPGEEKMIQSYYYNDDGKPTTIYKEQGSRPYNMSYTYHTERGWLTMVSSWGGFEQRLNRENDTTHPLYSGTISSMMWYLPGESQERKYTYSYDNAHRLTEASYTQSARTATSGASSFTEYELSVMEASEVPSDAEPFLFVEQDDPLSYIPSLTSTAQAGITSPSIGTDAVSAISYGESYNYDRNGNILRLKRYGRGNTTISGLVDDVTISYDGNQRIKATDSRPPLIYSGASDFVDGANTAVEYAYDGNGSLTMDLNRGIQSITYDLRGNVQNIAFSSGRGIQYVYSADGTRRRAIHTRSTSTGVIQRDTTDYIGALTLHNRSLDKLQFPGGYVSFSTNNTPDWHYYIQDYMGNVRMVVNSDGTVEQKTHYYPYGGVIGYLSTNHDHQLLKFEGKELDRQFGLDWYDIHARQYDAIGVPSWNKVDRKAEDYYHLSPYVFAGGDPVNNADYDGESHVLACAVGGAVIGASVNFVASILNGDDANEMISNVASGFVSGGISGAALGIGNVGLAAEFFIATTAGFAGGAMGEETKQQVEIALGTREDRDNLKVVDAAYGGAATGFLGKATGEVLGSAFHSYFKWENPPSSQLFSETKQSLVTQGITNGVTGKSQLIASDLEKVMNKANESMGKDVLGNWGIGVIGADIAQPWITQQTEDIINR